MAAIIPSLSTIRGMTTGERRFGRRLEALLEDDYTVWYDIPVGRQRRYPDFIILHPSRGLLFLEIKDWKLATLKKISKDRVTLQTQNGLDVVSNPLEQARQYAQTTVNVLKTDPQLRQSEGRYQGRLCCPYGYGVVLTNITRQQWNKALPEDHQELVLPAHRVICKDEMTESVEAEAFQSRLWGMFEYSFGEKLSLPQVDRIRWHLFPEVRINAPQQDLFGDSDDDPDDEHDSASNVSQTLVPEIVRVMDIQQEQLAKSLGDGHRVIHGVAGSGKTLILGYRCLHLSQATRKPILVLCFNIALAARLRSFMSERGIDEQVQVYHFHEWCGLQLKTYHVDTEQGARPLWERQGTSVIAGVERGDIPRAQYGALMIDEGHDFEPEWLKLVVQMIDPDTNSLLLLYDDAQAIYSRRQLGFPLSSAGIQARGRTTILKLNYRNTREILTFAYDFSKEYLQAQDADDDHVPLIQPEVAGASGPQPVYRPFKSAADEYQYIVRCVDKWRSGGKPLSSIAIIYAHHHQGEALKSALDQAGVPAAWLKSSVHKKTYNPADEKVTLLTRQSSKGLEFDTVILSGVGALKDGEDDMPRETRLLYVGMTRAKQQLLVTSGSTNLFTDRLQELAHQAV
ncbi:3'-5' exonuclease [uncultured Marinimicrobium sp.]|uniref:DEAD/DEAH box helicase n=1 Tax=uncultured Marinimicrobium sp. TaxID=503840 RepID=UPI0030DB936D